jgi:UDP-N-acetylmuramyl-tripeptide synthetase
LFVAIKGAIADGHDFIEAAIERGAIGIVSEQPAPPDTKAAWLQVVDARRALAEIAAHVHGDPSTQLQLIGVTGTNGKTTTAFIMSDIAERAGATVALLSTIEQRTGKRREPALHTTPEASDTERFLRRAVDEGCRVAVMECSSQALDLRRCDALNFSVAIWTNLTQDHLDYHGDMESYYRSKRQLFDSSLGNAPRFAVINTDDAYGRRLLDELSRATIKPDGFITYALDDAAHVRATDMHASPSAMRFRLHTPAGNRDVSSPLVGRPMLYNILAASAAALKLGCELDQIAAAIKRCTGAPGRFERVAHNGDFAVIVDYAHTEDALRSTLKTAREVARGGRIITVFGCGGDRDRTKRRPMGEAAAEGSDLVILTSDNPRTEDPQQILRDTEAGLTLHQTPYRITADRRTAIHEAIAEARAGDLVLIAGKGHENYQVIGTEKLQFDDCEVAREALEAG